MTACQVVRRTIFLKPADHVAESRRVSERPPEMDTWPRPGAEHVTGATMGSVWELQTGTTVSQVQKISEDANAELVALTSMMTMKITTDMKKRQCSNHIGNGRRLRELTKDMMVMKEMSIEGLVEMKEPNKGFKPVVEESFEMKDVKGRTFTKSSPR